MARRSPPAALLQCLLRSGAARLFRSLTRRLCGRGIRILFTHRVLDDTAREERDWARAWGHMTRREFESRIAFVVRHYRPISLDRCLELLSTQEPLREDYVVLTLDDGYADNLRNACPVLHRYQVPATFFVSTGAVGTSSLLWVDQVYQAIAHTERKVLRADWLKREVQLGSLRERMVAGSRVVNLLKRVSSPEREQRQRDLLDWLGGTTVASEADRMLTWDEARQLSRNPLFSIGAHTVSHAVLTSLSRDEARREVEESVGQLSHEIGRPCSHFAYPNGKKGDFTPFHVALLRSAGVRSACTTIAGTNLPGSDAYRLRRAPLAPRARLRYAGRSSARRARSISLRRGGCE